MRGDYITPSGRRWSASPCRYHRAGTCTKMQPLGSDVSGGGGIPSGGVRAMHVANERLERGDKIWKPTTQEVPS